jgi:bifunctional non-homologous end joining protein LigD
MSLAQYKRKRNFGATPEPEGKAAKPRRELVFTVQRHHASRLHYDFRLELQGTLKSWAVPKGPSLNPADKRLAMMVEDHPVSYADFEGMIPEGNYGAGQVTVWDHGTYEPVDGDGKKISAAQFTRDLASGSIKFRLKGRKLKGEFALVQMKKDEQSWLLIKHRDRYATDDPYDSEEFATKRALAYTAQRAEGKKTPAQTRVVKKKVLTSPQPSAYREHVRPMLARLADKPFDDPGWIYEIKWDGYRAIAEIDGKNTRFYSRKGISFHEKYPELYAALAQIRKRMVIDGEVVAFDDKGAPGFQNLQQYQPNGNTQLVFYVFDILYLNGKSVKDKPLIERKELLRSVLPESDLIRYCDHIEGAGVDFFKVLGEKGLEGMIAKRADSLYREGARNGEWLKLKHVLTEEAVIAGYTEARGGRPYFGALVLGTYEQGRLTYIGHTGTGFNNKTLKELYHRLQPLVTNKNPFGKKVRVNMPVTWVRPQLVCQIKYTEVTAEGNRRHPVFLGLREDKGAEEVHPEISHVSKDKVMSRKSTAGRKVNLSNLDKVYWPEEGYTKGDVIDYYNSVYRYIIRHLKGRPQSLKRTPNGIEGESFYHKDAGEQAPEWMATYPVWSESSEKTVDYLVCNDKSSLQYLANLGCIELNPWHSRVDTPDNPDYLALDLDPSEKNSFAQVTECARVIREILERAGVDCYCKTSGATGLHIYVPLGAQYDYAQARSFAELIARLTHEQLPDTTTLERSLSKRSKKHIYLDYLQNKPGATLASVYSLRPRPGAPVSTPLEWKEVKDSLDPLRFNIKNTLKRLEKKGDLFAPVLRRGINMEKALRNLSA